MSLKASDSFFFLLLLFDLVADDTSKGTVSSIPVGESVSSLCKTGKTHRIQQHNSYALYQKIMVRSERRTWNTWLRTVTAGDAHKLEQALTWLR